MLVVVPGSKANLSTVTLVLRLPALPKASGAVAPKAQESVAALGEGAGDDQPLAAAKPGSAGGFAGSTNPFFRISTRAMSPPASAASRASFQPFTWLDVALKRFVQFINMPAPAIERMRIVLSATINVLPLSLFLRMFRLGIFIGSRGYLQFPRRLFLRKAVA